MPKTFYPGDLVRTVPVFGGAQAGLSLGADGAPIPFATGRRLIDVEDATVMLYLGILPAWEKGIEMLGEGCYWNVVLAGDRKLYIPNVFKLEAL